MENENISLKHLINLSSNTNINIYNKNKIKSKDKIINECEKVKKKELKNSSILLANLAKLSTDINEVKNIYSNLENKISKIDQIINIVNSEQNIFDSDFIESYSNC